MGGPPRATPCLVMIAFSVLLGSVRAVIMRLGNIAAVLRPAMRLRMVYVALLPAASGPHPSGCISLTLATEMEASLSGTLRSTSAGAWALAARTPMVAACVTTRPTAVDLWAEATRGVPRHRAAQFKGGLTVSCSRLGRARRRTVGLPSKSMEFVGTSLRCLGPRLAVPLRLGGSKRPAWPPATRTLRSRWPTTPSASRRGPGLATPPLNPALLLALPPFEPVLPTVLARRLLRLNGLTDRTNLGEKLDLAPHCTIIAARGSKSRRLRTRRLGTPCRMFPTCSVAIGAT